MICSAPGAPIVFSPVCPHCGKDLIEFLGHYPERCDARRPGPVADAADMAAQEAKNLALDTLHAARMERERREQERWGS